MKSLSRIFPAAVLSLALPVVAFGAEPQPDQALDKAKALFDAGKWGEADCILDEYSKRHPAPSRLSEALVLQGRCREKRGDFAAAQKLYGRVAHDDAMLRKDPEAVAAAYDRLHALQVSQGASATSRRRLIDECRRRIRNADALSRICEREGDALAAAGDFRGALASYKAAPSLSEPGHAVMALLAGGTAPSRRITGGDIETLSKIAEAKPDLARPLCLALSKCRDGWLAEDFLASSLLAGGKSEKAAEIWAGMVKRRIGPTDSIAYSYCEALAETRPQEAMAELDRWLANNRKSPLAEKARLTRARLEAAHGDRERAAAMFEKFVSDFQQSALADIARHELAEILKTIAIAEAQKAKEVARAEAAKRNPLLAKVEAGEALLRQRKYREAARAFVALRTSASPAMRDRVLYGLGEALHGLGDCNGAIDAFRAAARIGASATNGVHAAKAYRAIGDILLEDTGEHGKAVAAYEKSMALRPDMADDGFWMNYGLALMVSGREEDAAWIFAERRDKVRDNIAEFAKWDNLAKACSKGREEKKTLIEERKALADLRLAEALMDGGADARALDVFRRTAPVARRMGAGDRCALGMAQCFAATGKTKDALKAYGVFAREFADSPLAPQALLCAGVLCASPGNNNFKEARKYFDAVAQRHPAALEATAAEFYSATLAWRARKWDEAERLHRAFIEKHPDSPLARVAMEERLPAIAEKSLAVPSRALNIRKLSAMVSPNARIRHSCRIDQAVSCNAEFAIYPESGWRIVSSELRCGAHNGASALWTGPDPGTPHRHVYHLCDAFSSQELAMFDGEIAPEGDGGRPRTWPFRVTIPAVDIDWEGLGGSSDEDGEDLRYALLPLNGDGTSEARRILLRSPFDDDERDGRPGFPHGSKVSPTITLKWSPANSISLLRDGTTGITSGWSVNARDVSSWPISFDVVPMVTSGTFTVSCEGQSTGWGSALDRIKGRFAHVDLDVDANNDGVINGDDEATEMTKGGIVAVGSNGKIPINLSVGPTNLPGRITLSATSGGEQIRVWNQWRTATIKLPKTWNSAELVPDTLYIEGVSPSEHMRDVRLRLRYDENLPGESSAVAQCDDKIALTVIKAELEIFKPRVIDSSESMIPADEKLSKGSVTFVNLDNDDQDAYFDLGGATPDTNVAGGDDELIKLKLEITPSGIADGQAKLLLMSGGNTVAVWTNATKEASSAYAWGTKFNVPDDFSVEGHSLVKTLWVEGIAAHTVEREALLYFEFSTANIVSSDLAALTVIGIESVSWKGKGNSLSGTDSLDADPNWPSGLFPAALRVFPGARIENGSVGAARDKVDVEVSLSVEPPQPLSVYLRSFDVDDPTDDTAPIDNEANEEDNRGSTPKRAGKFTGESGGVFELRFNAGQKTATCEFQTTMQPGDNFRVVANGDRDFLLGLENKDSSQNTGGTTSDKNANKQRICDRHMSGNPSDKEIRFPLQYASPVLTVWRLLHIEVDSMAAPPSSGTEKNFVEGNLTSVASFGTVAERVGLDINLRSGLTPPDNSANKTTGTGTGRFENGWIKIGSGTGTPGQTTTTGLDGNGDDFVERLAGIDIPVVVTKTGQPDITGKVWEWNGNRFVLCSLSANLSSSYNGGTLNVAGVSSAIATIASPNIVNVASAPSIPFILHDDDDDTVLPDLPDTTQVRVALSPCSILPVYDVGVSSQNVPFKRNVSLDYHDAINVEEWDSQSLNAPNFWVAYVLTCFQGDVSRDRDPSRESKVFGITTVYLGGSLIFREVHRSGENTRDPIAEEQDTVVHEIGHAIGRFIDEPVTDGFSRYVPNCVDAIRKATNPWP